MYIYINYYRCSGDVRCIGYEYMCSAVKICKIIHKGTVLSPEQQFMTAGNRKVFMKSIFLVLNVFFFVDTYICPVLGLLIPLFCISGDVSSKF